MASQVFNKLLQDAANKGIVGSQSATAVQWLRKAASRVPATRVSPSKMLAGNQDASRFDNKVQIGHMYMFMYDPKTKGTLPYYDSFPLIFPFAKAPGGFYGINMHYLHPRLRAILMDRLMDTTLTNELQDETTRLRLSYKVLTSASKFRYFEPCVKHYLTKHVRSRFIHVHPNEWQMALFLPTEQFHKADKKAVWQNSQDQIGKL